MKKLILSLFVAIMATVVVQAQQIAVVSGSSTSIYRSLETAISKAPANSVIYLPGGGFPISDEVKITKPLTIIGIGHKVRGDNADGYTTITGNLQFDEGSSQSAVLGCYITGNVIIGGTGVVNDITVRYCNLNSVQVKNANCLETVVNQCYVRGTSDFNGANGYFTHNIAYSIYNLDNGYIEYNIFTTDSSIFGTGNVLPYPSQSTSIIGNVFHNYGNKYTSQCLTSDNLLADTTGNWGEGPVDCSANYSQLFENPAGITPYASYKFKEEYKNLTNRCGIYVGNGFSDDQLPPVPYITDHRIPEQTDANGMLNIKVRVIAGE